MTVTQCLLQEDRGPIRVLIARPNLNTMVGGVIATGNRTAFAAGTHPTAALIINSKADIMV